MEYTHGGDRYSGEHIALDFSVNLNPMGPPPCAVEAAQRSLAYLDRYPDPFCRALSQAAAQRDGTDAKWILWGNGAADLLFRFAAALRPRRALIPAPTFSEYEKALSLNQCNVKIHYIDPQDGFFLTPKFLEKIGPEIDLVMICDPNNPTGQLTDPGLLSEILSRCRQVGAILAVDQCFLELSSGDPRSLVEELPGGGLILFRALTKSYALAGLRLGYCLCADRELLDRMAAAGQPWPVSVTAQAAGEAALVDAPDWPFMGRLEREGNLKRLQNGLSALGCAVLESQSNFVLFQSGILNLGKRLREHGILIRDCRDFRSLEHGGYYRAAVRPQKEIDELLAVLGRLNREA